MAIQQDLFPPIHNQKIIHGDCLEVMKEMPDNSIDFIVTDPPYGISFMAKQWDVFTPPIQYWKQALRICVPGAMIAVFGGTRTHHRLMCSIEDAGFEIRDVIMWVYGSGFPKSHNISKAIDKAKGLEREITQLGQTKPFEFSGKFDQTSSHLRERRDEALSDLAKTFNGYGTALKPAYEPIIIAMKPLEGTFAENAEKWGVAGINVDESRIGLTNGENPSGSGNRVNQSIYNKGWNDPNKRFTPQSGRWPANIIFDEEAAKELDQMTGILKSGKVEKHHKHSGKKEGIYGKINGGLENETYGDSGGASRFFYCAKASSSERNKGLEGMPLKDQTVYGEMKGTCEHSKNRCPQTNNNHPTVKPIALMKYIIKLLAPPNSPILLDPFAGSGSTIVAAKELGINAIGIEKEKEYVEIALKRIENV
jgi:DNA modification methylase